MGHSGVDDGDEDEVVDDDVDELEVLLLLDDVELLVGVTEELVVDVIEELVVDVVVELLDVVLLEQAGSETVEVVAGAEAFKYPLIVS